MELVLTHEGRCAEVVVEVGREGGCVADLLDAAAATGLMPASVRHLAGIEVEGVFHGRDIGLDEVVFQHGQSVDCVARPTSTPQPVPLHPVLVVTDGPSAGARLAVQSGVQDLGRHPDLDLVVEDPTVSQHHARVTVDDEHGVKVQDLGSANGTWLDGRPVLRPTSVRERQLLRVGAAHLTLAPPASNDAPSALTSRRPSRRPTLPFNRPPRPALPPPPERVAAPEPPTTPGSRAMLSAAMIVAPLLMAGILIWMYGNPRFALFMLLSPVMAVGNWLSQRRRSRRDQARSSRRFDAELRRLDRRLRAGVAAEVSRRRTLLPDAAEVVRRATQPSTRLWERRGQHADALRLRAGVGAVAWQPPVESPRQGSELVDRVLDRHRLLRDCPVEVDLSAGGVVGLVGDRSAALALARSLVVQLAVHHGPADVPMAVCARDDRVADWDWAKWLPHLRRGGGRAVTSDTEDATVLLEGLLSEVDRDEAHRDAVGSGPRIVQPTRCWVLDDPALLAGRRAPARRVLAGAAGPATGIVVAEHEDQLPAVCTTVIDLHSPFGDARLRRPQAGEEVEQLVICGMSEATARTAARALARFEDPEQPDAGTALPTEVGLLEALGMFDVDGGRLASVWGSVGAGAGVRFPVGVGVSGVVEVDLVSDGPHGLVGGTTGSGKSELLRSLVAGAAARVGPDRLVFVLVDYKGGSAFARCADLPHTVGLVTDLDEHLGQRALTSFEAELKFRERVLASVGCEDLGAYVAAGCPAGPLPRLVVVIDEFATLAAQLPDFLGALVGVAQRGRSLGVHLVLATQRPSGAVNANIKANTNLRVALRVQDVADSTDIIDGRDAAGISRETPGRAYVRRGAGDVVMVQTPLSTASAPVAGESVRVVPFVFGATGSSVASGSVSVGASDLDRIVDAAREAFVSGGFASPRRPWLPMLAARVGFDDLAEVDDDGEGRGVGVGVVDVPEEQARRVARWDPGSGHLGVFGTVGSGTTTALLTVACGLVADRSPQQVHLYGLDFGAGELGALSVLPHVGAVVGANEPERQHRLIRRLRRELDARRDLPPGELAHHPQIVVLIDGLGALLAAHEGIESTQLVDDMRRVFTEGTALGIHFAVTGDRAGAVPSRLASAVGKRLVLRLADPGDYAAFGLRERDLPRFVPGRAVEADTRQVLQLALPASLSELAARHPTTGARPEPLRTLPVELHAADLEADEPDAAARLVGSAAASTESAAGDARLWLPVGLGDEELVPVGLELHPGEHAMVAGPARSGRTSTLLLLAEGMRRADPDAIVVGLCRRSSALHGWSLLDASGPPDDLRRVLRSAADDPRRWLVLVDDAPGFDDPDGLLEALVSRSRDGLHVVGSARTDELRGDYGQWHRRLRRSRTGLLLRPDLPGDGDLLSARLPRRVPVPLQVPGRGFLVTSGASQLVQVARPRVASRAPVEASSTGAT